MDSDNMYKQEIEIKDLLFVILYKWRPIVLIAILLGLIMGGYRVGKAFVQREDKEYIKQVQEEYQFSLDEFDRMNHSYEREIETLQLGIEERAAYLENSILMKISPYDKYVASADIFIKMEDIQLSADMGFFPLDYTSSIVKAYVTYLNNGIELDLLAKNMRTEVDYLEELIEITPDYASNMMSISVCYTDEAGAGKILDALLDCIDDEYSSLKSKLGAHNVYIMNKTSGTVTDVDLYTKQKKSEDDFAIMKKTLKEKKEALKDLKKPVVSLALSRKEMAISGMKYTVIGGVIGAFITVFFICVVFLLSDKVSSAKDLKRRFYINVLGEFPQQRKQRMFGCVDKWLDKLKGETACITEKTRYELIGEYIKSYAADARHILIAGTVEMELLEWVANEIKQVYPDVVLTVGANINETAVTVRLLSECDAVILVEQAGVSKYREVEKEIEVVCSMKKQIIGSVVV